MTAEILVIGPNLFCVMRINTNNCSNFVAARATDLTSEPASNTPIGVPVHMVNYQHIFVLEGPVGLVAVYETANIKT